jgi:hypothetical protein
MSNYATAAEMRAQINKTSIVDDAILTAILSAAEKVINGFCNRPDGFIALAVATARKYAGQGLYYLAIDETPEITLVEVKKSSSDSLYTAWASGDWIAFSGDPKDPNFNRTPYTMLMVDPTGSQSIFTSGVYKQRAGFKPDSETSRGVPTVQVTAKWGYATTVPADIKEACIMQAARWYKRLEGAMSDALASGELGQLLYRQSLDPDLKMILVGGRYVKPALGRR